MAPDSGIELGEAAREARLVWELTICAERAGGGEGMPGEAPEVGVLEPFSEFVAPGSDFGSLVDRRETKKKASTPRTKAIARIRFISL